MGRNETKAKPTAWNIGQFRVIRPRIQRIARQAVDEAVRGPFQVKQSTEEKIITQAGSAKQRRNRYVLQLRLWNA
jgi:hypothetical protein